MKRVTPPTHPPREARESWEESSEVALAWGPGLSGLCHWE